MKNKELGALAAVMEGLRREKKMRREYLAQRSGVCRDAISKMEQGKTDVPFCRLMAYLRALHVKPAEFWERYEKIASTSPLKEKNGGKTAAAS